MMSVEDFAHEIGGFRRALAGMARRMLVKLTDGTTWQVSGHALFDPTRPETRTVEQWPGIGVFARPPGDAEALVLNVGGQNNPQIVATRDEATRAAAVGDTAPDESNLYNSKARVYVKADGSIEARSIGGTALELATKADLEAVVAYLRRQFDPNTGHTHLAIFPGQSTPIVESAIIPPAPGAGTCPTPDGTSVLKGE